MDRNKEDIIQKYKYFHSNPYGGAAAPIVEKNTPARPFITDVINPLIPEIIALII